MSFAGTGETSPGTCRETMGPRNTEQSGVVGGVVSQGQETVNLASSGPPMSLLSFHQSFKGNQDLS